ncbi:hypothetical protein [Kaarinaea lacus]
MRHPWVAVLCIGMSLLLVGQSAIAQTATFEITATVFDISDPDGALNGGVNYGDQISGTYTIDISTPDDDPGLEYAHYLLSAQPPTTPQQGFDLILNNFSFKSDPGHPWYMLDIFMMNSYSDQFGMGSWGNVPLSNGASVEDIYLDLYDSTGTALTNTELSVVAPDVSKFEIHDIHMSGMSPYGQYYSINAKIDSIVAKDAVACTPTDPSLVTFDLSATVREVYDYDNVLGNALNPGDAISGNYTFNLNTPDMDPYPDFGRYEHVPGSGVYGFDINVVNINIKTNTNLDTFAINIEDNPTGPDSYSVDQFGSPIPFINNSTLDYLNILLWDNSGGMQSTTALTNEPPYISPDAQRDMYIGGSGTTAAGMSYFSVVADVVSISKSTSSCDTPTNPIAISPASGVFDGAQRFDAAVILEKDLSSLMYMEGTLNGFDISYALASCFPGAPNSENRQTFVCPDFSNLLMPGNNQLKINFTLTDGSIISNYVDWMVYGY